ncbi:MAG: ClpXP protease specificity-enhancing factor SspB [Nannocystaceae bacterium]
MENRFKRVIESLHREGACPRLQIDLTRDGVVCPDFIVEQWGERLIIDLDPSYPLNLAFTAIGVEADLSFGGHVTRCVFPYASIYGIFDRATGRGAVFEENMPASVRRERERATTPSEPSRPPVPAKERGAGESRRRRRRPRAGEADEASAAEEAAEADPPPREATPPTLGLAAVEATDTDDNDDEDADATPDPAAEERQREVDRRRAIFKVIDGGQ